MEKNFSLLMVVLWIILVVASKEEKELNLNFQQHDYHFTFERIELVRYNKEYIKEMSIVTFKYNRTQAVANWTFAYIIDVGNDLVLMVQAYKFMSNEYRLFPARFAVHLCKALAADTAGARRMLACGNFTGCPILKGKKQHICNFSTDENKLPPFLPNGKYKTEAQAVYFSTEVFVLNIYASVTRPLQWED